MAAGEQRILRREALLLGDSITQFGFSIDEGCAPGWASILAYKFARKVDVLNRGYSGYNTRKVLAAVPILLAEQRREKLLFATLFLGANDAAPLEDEPLCSHVPLAEYEDNLKKIGQQLLEAAEVLIIIAPPPCDESLKEGSMLFGRTLEVTRAYAAAAGRAAAAIGARFLDTFSKMLACSEEEWQAMLSDGLHLSSKGNRFVGQAVLELLAAGVPPVTPESLAWDLPGWRDLDRDDPSASLTRDAVEKLEAPGVRNALDVVGPLR